MTANEMIQQMRKMENGERIDFLKYLYQEHFNVNPITEEEMKILEDLRDGYVKVVENNEASSG